MCPQINCVYDGPKVQNVDEGRNPIAFVAPRHHGLICCVFFFDDKFVLGDGFEVEDDSQ